MSRIRPLVAALAIALTIPAAVAGCGGSSGNNEDPNQVLKETFNNPTKVTSGQLDIDLSGSAEGAQSGSLTATIGGPFQGDASNPDTFPQVDLTAKISASGGGQSFNFDGSLITTKDNAYVEYQGQAYEVGTTLYKQFLKSYQQSQSQAQAQDNQDASSFFKRFGVDPATWLTDVSNEGTTDVDGTETIHIHGEADVPQILSDIQGIAQQSGGGQTLTPKQIDQVKSAVKSASIDVYSGTSDKLLRKLALSIEIAPPESANAPVSSVNADFSVTLSKVNEPQTIKAPSGAKSLSDLLGQFGINVPLGALGSVGAGGSSSSGALPQGTGGSSQAYADCLKSAKTPADLQKCAQAIQ